MEHMTPEERLIRTENLLHSLVDSQVQLQAQQVALTETQIRHEAEIDKHTAAIRDLILVSRSVLNSQEQGNRQIRELGEALKTLTEKVDRLADNIDTN